jgi:homocitrate synthase NifV
MTDTREIHTREIHTREIQNNPSEGYASVPHLIDATLPVYHEKASDLVSRHAQRWRELMRGIGVFKVKMPSAKVFSTDSLMGLDSAMLGDFGGLFSRLMDLEIPEIIFGNRYGLATAAAAAWLEAGGRGVVSSLGGAGGLPALEELRLMLHTSGILTLSRSSHSFSGLRDLGELFSGEKTQSHKPVTGWAIFAVESGIHVDGLMKDPALYEPYPPALVGGRRLLSVGLHSGRNSIRLKCQRLGIPCDDSLVEDLWAVVRQSSLDLGRGLTDFEFLSLHGELSLRLRGSERTELNHEIEAQG